MSARKPTEDDFQRAVCIYLDRCALPGVVWWHTPNGGRRDKREAKRFRDMGVKPGVHDLLFLHRGRLFGLELKRPGGTGRASPDQKDMHAAMLAAGLAGSAVVDSLPDVQWQLAKWGLAVPPPVRQ